MRTITFFLNTFLTELHDFHFKFKKIYDNTAKEKNTLHKMHLRQTVFKCMIVRYMS